MGMGGGKGMGTGKGGGMDKGKGGPAVKRARMVEGCMAQSTGDPQKDELIVRIKAFQRSGEEQKQMWWTYADAELGGKRDPAKHDVSTLDAFVALYGVP